VRLELSIGPEFPEVHPCEVVINPPYRTGRIFKGFDFVCKAKEAPFGGGFLIYT
jgi:hypothetical protein